MDLEYLKNKKILLVDDEQELLAMVEEILEKEGYRNIRRAGTVKEALGVFREWQPEMAVLDVMLPDGDGFGLFEQIRESSDIPVLFLTARGEEEDKFLGLGLGADDYIVKPFLPRELILRIGVILRRCYKREQPLVRLAGCSIDFERAQVIKGGETLPLTAKEFALLEVLAKRRGQIVSKTVITELVWDICFDTNTNVVEATVKRLRSKLETDDEPKLLHTIRGMGYILELRK